MSDLWHALVAIAQLALRRHAEALIRQPKRGATAYLRAALRAARQMGTMSKADPDLLAVALEIVDQVVRDAGAAEASVFALGGNSSAYLTLLTSAAALRITLLEKARHQVTADQPHPEPSPDAQPMRQTKSVPAPPRQLRTTPVATLKTPPNPTHQPPHYRKTSGAKLKVS